MEKTLNFLLQQLSYSEKPKDLNGVTNNLPFILKDRSLMPPGTYNGFYLSPEVIKQAFENADWNLKEIRSLFTGHPENPVPSEWVGEIQNAYFDNELGGIKGDIVLVDPAAAIKIAYGAKFGISPSIAAETDSHVVKKFTFRNFGLVIQPAMVRNYLNNALKKEGNPMEEEIQNQILEAINSMKADFEVMKKDITELKMSAAELEISDDEILEMAKQGSFAEFYKKFRKKYPKATMKDAAKAYKKQVGVEGAKKEKYPYPEEDKKFEEEPEQEEEKAEEESEEEKKEGDSEEDEEKVDMARAPKFSSFYNKLKKKDKKMTKTKAKAMFKKKYPKAKIKFEEDEPAEEKNNEEETTSEEPVEDKSVTDRLADIERKIDKPVRESETGGGTGSGETKIEDPNKVFFEWIRDIQEGKL